MVTHRIDRDGLEALLSVLRDEGFRPFGLRLRDGAVAPGEIRQVSDLPVGWVDEQEPGRYRLRRSGNAVFGVLHGQHGWTRLLSRAERSMWQAHTGSGPLVIEPTPAPARKGPLALVGVRACDLAAIGILDRLLLGDGLRDMDYARTREDALVIAATCTRPGGTCFCASTGTGPRARIGFDLSLTELERGTTSWFAVEVGTDRGRSVLNRVPHEPATDAEIQAVALAVDRASRGMVRSLDTATLQQTLRDRRESRLWEEVGARCLACGNCTMVCPTCVCTADEETGELLVGRSERRRRWASCLHEEFTHIHGGAVRRTVASRYRHWSSHKFGTWHEQFDSGGCAGCGRCITWCPVAIDTTEVLRALQDEATPGGGHDGRRAPAVS